MKRILGIVILVAIVCIPIGLAISRPGGGTGLGRPEVVAVAELKGFISDATGDTVAEARGKRPFLDHLAKAREDSRVAAVVIRINSGGGTAAFSQEIHRAVQKVREAGKPVVVSMGDTATSGAYYVATAADRILANPGTITGSIGVYVSYLKAAGLAETYGVEYVTVKSGPHKDIGNPTEPLADEQRAMLQALVDDTLDQFVADVARARGLDVETVRRVADGRVLTGAQAKELGLIDDFGGLEDAIELAADLAGIDGKPRVILYRDPVPWYARLLEAAADGRLVRSLGAQLLRSWPEELGQPRLMF